MSKRVYEKAIENVMMEAGISDEVQGRVLRLANDCDRLEGYLTAGAKSMTERFSQYTGRLETNAGEVVPFPCPLATFAELHDYSFALETKRDALLLMLSAIGDKALVAAAHAEIKRLSRLDY